MRTTHLRGTDVQRLSVNTIRTLAMDAVEAAASGSPRDPDGPRSCGLPPLDAVPEARSVRRNNPGKEG
jgi:hypothetical protein